MIEQSNDLKRRTERVMAEKEERRRQLRLEEDKAKEMINIRAHAKKKQELAKVTNL